jgi:hypothetical protein
METYKSDNMVLTKDIYLPAVEAINALSNGRGGDSNSSDGVIGFLEDAIGN